MGDGGLYSTLIGHAPTRVTGCLAFRPEEMPDIDPAIMAHRLNVDPLHKSVIQKKRHMGLERAVVATAEV